MSRPKKLVPNEDDDGSMRRYEKDAKDNSRHLTTIVGPQAECRETQERFNHVVG